NQINDLRGQYTGTSAYPDLYFGTQHNGVWGVGPSRIGGDCPEGWRLSALRRVPSTIGATITYRCPGHIDLSQQLLQHVEVPEWLNGDGLGEPVVLAQHTYVQQTYDTP